MGFSAGILAQTTTKPNPPAKAKPAPPVKAEKKTKEAKPEPQKVEPPKVEPPKPEANLSVQEMLQRGFSLLQQGSLKEAVDTFRLATQKEAKNLSAFMGLGAACMQAKRYPEAVEAYRTAIELNPSATESYNNLALAYIETEQYDAARMTLGRGLVLRESDLRLRLTMAESYRREKDFAGARSAYEQALGYGASNPAVFNGLGNLNLQENRNQEALDCFDAALLLNKDDLEAQLGRSAALSSLERHNEAIDSARGVIAKIPTLAFGYAALGGAYEAKKEHGLAIAEYEKAIERDAKDPYNWGNLGWSLYGAEKYDRALEVSRKALGIDPKLVYVRLNVGLIYAVQDRWSEAKREYAEGLKLAALHELRAGIKDVKDALKRTPEIDGLKKALGLLTTEERRKTNTL
jgi:tetratricopeptide (TPR) repeat protein